LFHHRYSVPIVARLYRFGPQTFATLAANMSASRDTLTDTLAKLEANGVIERLPPRRPRPRYALTTLGHRVGATCIPLVELVTEMPEVRSAALKKWPMLVCVALGRGATRYNETKAALPGITARALALALKDLALAGMVERIVEDGYPPSPVYVLSAKGQRFFPALDELCRACEAAVSGLATVPASSTT
jgi:DNA-binding HxlR family transcriptional regulator